MVLKFFFLLLALGPGSVTDHGAAAATLQVPVRLRLGVAAAAALPVGKHTAQVLSPLQSEGGFSAQSSQDETKPAPSGRLEGH